MLRKARRMRVGGDTTCRKSCGWPVVGGKGCGWLVVWELPRSPVVMRIAAMHPEKDNGALTSLLWMVRTHDGDGSSGPERPRGGEGGVHSSFPQL